MRAAGAFQERIGHNHLGGVGNRQQRGNSDGFDQEQLRSSGRTARESADGPWVNILAVREEDKDKPWVKQLVEAYHSEPVKDFLEKRFKGTYIATW